VASKGLQRRRNPKHLDVLDLDLAILKEKLATITNASNNEEKAYYKA